MRLESRGGVSRTTTDLATDLMVAEVRKRSPLSVVTFREIEGALTLERQRQMAGCDQVGCAAEIAGAMNADQFIMGSVGRVGADDCVLSLSRVVARAGTVVGTSVRRVRGADESAILDALPGMVEEVFAADGVAPRGDAGAPWTAGQVEQAHEQALDLEESPHATPEEREAAWCVVAEKAPQVSLAREARERCQHWRTTVRATREREQRLAKDFDDLSRFLSLRRKNKAERLIAVDAFLASHGQVEDARVRAVVAARARIEKTGLAVLAGGLTPQESYVEARSGLEFVRVPEGTFRLGCATGDQACAPDEMPARVTAVGAFSLGRTEVPVEAYGRCVSAKACTPPGTGDELCNWPSRPKHPVNCVSWAQADAFCRWAGGRLPTVPEWEYAAKSGRDVVFPWGNEPFSVERANACDRQCNDQVKQDDGWRGASPVGQFPRGATPWGLLDMAGNVWEWTADDAFSPRHKVVRGGSFQNEPQHLRASFITGFSTEGQDKLIGFRCAR
jgi:formylglycine-generating enzyme required for sulfatase activity